MRVKLKRETLNEDIIPKLEHLRFDAYGMLDSNILCSETYYAKQLKKGTYVVYTCYIEEELVGACYVSNFNNSLYIEQLFTKKEYQNSNFSVGKSLMIYTLNDKTYLETYFNKPINKSYLSTRSSKLERYYEKLGYQKFDDVYMRKTI